MLFKISSLWIIVSFYFGFLTQIFSRIENINFQLLLGRSVSMLLIDRFLFILLLFDILNFQYQLQVRDYQNLFHVCVFLDPLSAVFQAVNVLNWQFGKEEGLVKVKNVEILRNLYYHMVSYKITWFPTTRIEPLTNTLLFWFKADIRLKKLMYMHLDSRRTTVVP